MTMIRPLGNRVLIKRLKPQPVKNGILLLDNSHEKTFEAEVIEVGPGRADLPPMTVKKGDRVMFSPYKGTEVKNISENLDDEFLILFEEDILGIFE